MKSSTEFVITRLDTRALQVMRHVDVDLAQPPTLDLLPSLDDYDMEQPTNVLPRPPTAAEPARTSRPERTALKRSTLSWPARISVAAGVLTFVVLACVAVLNG